MPEHACIGTTLLIHCVVHFAVDKAKPGSYVALQNARVDMFRGSMRLAVDGKVGQVEEATDLQFAPKVGSSCLCCFHL